MWSNKVFACFLNSKLVCEKVSSIEESDSKFISVKYLLLNNYCIVFLRSSFYKLSSRFYLINKWLSTKKLIHRMNFWLVL